MYAIVEIAGKQYRVEKDTKINVDKLDKNANEDLVIDRVLLVSNGETVLIGQPYVKNAKITAKVIGDVKGDKVKGVRFGKRKRFTRTIGHRQNYSQIVISELSVS
ncbi:MAG: 50S ribosomal protein L21 [Spirochaetes bacterium]|nr:50S ribosomal protein L21 [Spirochaetota bacterium]